MNTGVKRLYMIVQKPQVSVISALSETKLHLIGKFPELHYL